MISFTDGVAHAQLISLNKRWTGQSIPIRYGFIMLGRLVSASVFQLNASILAERHEVSLQKSILRFNQILRALCLSGGRGADGMARERQGHRLAAPIIASTSPFLSSCPLGLRSV